MANDIAGHPDTTGRPICYPDESPEKDNCLMPDQNRIDPTAAPAAPAVSPTGIPVLPPKFVPYGLAVLTVLGALAAAPTLGLSLIPVGVAQGAMLGALILGPLLGVASPGLRKQG